MSEVAYAVVKVWCVLEVISSPGLRLLWWDVENAKVRGIDVIQ